jgi:arylsulfatase A-like enzyme
MLIDFDVSGLTLGTGHSLVFSVLRVNSANAGLAINQRAGATSGSLIDSLVPGGDEWSSMYEIPAAEGSGTEFALQQPGGAWTGVSKIFIDIIGGGTVDTNAPTPNPAEWASNPEATGPFAITMTATTGTDESAIEYYFAETSGNSGGTDSGWQSSPTYTDFGLQPSNTYSYSVTMRDTVGNIGEVSIVASATTPAAQTGRTNGPPNVVFIYADDLGYADIGHNASVGSLAYTPNIDRICQEGVYLSNYLTHHVCTPSRAGLITGKYFTRVGSGISVNGTLDNSIPNIAKDFQAAGYKTGCFGKWHSSEPNFPTGGNGQYFSNGDMTFNELHQENTAPLDNGIFDKVWTSYPWGETVNAYGFDRFVGFFSGSVDYFDKYLKYYRDINWWHDGAYVPDEPGYLTDLISQHSLAFVETNRAVPFFCYVPHGAVHAPYDITRSDLEEMCNIWDDEYPGLAWDNVKMLEATSGSGRLIRDVEELRCTPGAEFDRETLDGQINGFADLVYYTMIYSMDKATGALLDRIEELGLTTNTIVVFSSDNGGVIGRGDNGLFRGGKTQIWEGGIHVPAAIWWPGRLDAYQAPYSSGDNVYSNLTRYVDWYPTLIGMTEQTLNGTDLDGINLSSNLFNRTSARPDFDNCYFGLDDYWAAVHSGRWKLHFNRVSGIRSTLLLYDLLNDPAESANVAASNPIERDTLIALMDQWFSSGDVTTSYMPLTGDSLPPYSNPAPAGEILEIKATQTGTISNRDQGVSVGFSKQEFKGLNIFDYYIQANDVIEYDIYVAGDSGHNSGLFCSPSRGSEPLFNTDLGVDPSGNMLFEASIPTGQWVRVAAGVGDIAPGPSSSPQYIGLFNPAPGYYHYYLDNVVVRRKDGTVRVMVWSSGNDTDTSPSYYFNGTKYTSLPAASPFSTITLTTQDISVLGSTPDSGMNYSEWMDNIGGLEGLDPTGAGPTNQWPLVTEYGLGSDPSTYTAGFTKSTNYPGSNQLGTYAFRELFVDAQNKDYFTMSFDFNREASDIEIVLQESSNLVDWVDSLVLQPPYTDTSGLASSSTVVSVSDNAPGDYTADTTRITARSAIALDDGTKGFLKLEVRPTVAAPSIPLYLIAVSHDGILLEWSSAAAQEQFVIERAPAGTDAFARIAETTNYQYTDRSAIAGISYDYRVRAVNAAGLSSWSNTASITR